MRRVLICFLIGFISLACGCRVYAEEELKPPFEISVVSGKSSFRHLSPAERVESERKGPDFKVVLKNTSLEPIKLQYWSCGGKEVDLSFELSVKGDVKILEPIRPICSWTEERYFTIAPQKEEVFDIYISIFGWDCPKVSSATSAWIKARYNFTLEVPKGDKRGKPFQGSDIWLWKGKIESEPLVFDIVP